jgi:GTP cyclohydrolase II
MHADARARPIQGALLHVESQRVATRHGPFCVEVLRDLAARRHLPVLVRGDVRTAQPLLAHVHVACTASECMAGCDCDCAERLDAALASMAAEGRGILFYLMLEGRGAGAWAAARGRMAVQANGGHITRAEAYDLIGLHDGFVSCEPIRFARQLLGVTAPLRLLSDDDAQVAALEAQGVAVHEVVPLRTGAGAAPALELPEEVVYFDPQPLPDAPRFLRMASHLLPVRAGAGEEPLWFRLHAYLDRESGHERCVLTHGGLREPLVRFQRDALLERLAPEARRSWPRAARSIAAHGAGCAVFLHAQLAGQEPALPDEAALALVAHHVKGRRARLLVDAPGAAAVEAACAEALHRRGISLEAPLVLSDAP